VWPRLPLKKPGGPGAFPHLAFLYDVSPANEPPDIRFVSGNIFMTSVEEIRTAPKANPEALDRDGWLVD